MLPYSLKVVWFSVSLAGLLSNWTVLPGFARHVFASPWVSLLYTATNTVLQVIFCIGLIWRMDPFKMPSAFCITQTVLTQVAWACLSGLCTSMTLNTAAAVFGYSSGFLRNGSRTPVAIALTSLVSVIVLVLQLIFLLRLHAAQPFDSLTCDASHPTWVRVLGYAGIAPLLSISCIALSIVTARRLLSRSQRTTTSRATSHAVLTQDTLTSLPNRRDRKVESKPGSRFSALLAPDAPAQYIKPSPVLLPKSLRPVSLGRSPTLAKHSRYHLPFDNMQPQSESQSRRASAQSQAPSQLRRSPALDSSLSRQVSESNQNSPSPIIFAAPPSQPGQAQEPSIIVVNVSHTPSPVPQGGLEDDEKGMEAVHQINLSELDADLGSDEMGSLHWVGESDHGSIGKEELAYERTEEGDTGSYVFPPYPRIRRVASGLPPWLDEPPDPDPSILRTVLFQLFLAATQILAAITSLIDTFSKNHTISPLGTQHVAQLLVAWGPFLFICMILLSRYCSRALRT